MDVTVFTYHAHEDHDKQMLRKYQTKAAESPVTSRPFHLTVLYSVTLNLIL